MKEYTLSVIIVTYNSQHYIAECVTALRKALSGISAEIIVIDNSSHDATVPMIQSSRTLIQKSRLTLRVVQNSENRGYTTATNQGLEAARGKFLLLLNPDVIVNNAVVNRLLEFLRKNEDVGIVAPQLRFADGTVQPSVRRFPGIRDILCEATGLSKLFPKSKRFNRWKMGDFDFHSASDVEQPQGAFLLTRINAVQKIGALDESLRMFFSDVDWCRRFIDNGWRIVFRPEVYAIHYKGASIYSHRVPMLIASHRDFARYLKKYADFRRVYRPFVEFFLLVLVWPRIAIFFLKKKG